MNKADLMKVLISTAFVVGVIMVTRKVPAISKIVWS
jgi:hypothetical protein